MTLARLADRRSAAGLMKDPKLDSPTEDRCTGGGICNGWWLLVPWDELMLGEDVEGWIDGVVGMVDLVRLRSSLK